MSKTKKQRKSNTLFGINDCHKPKNNTKRNYEYRIHKIYNRPKNLKTYQKNKIKSIILFHHNLGQTKHGVEKAPKYLKKFINKKKYKLYNVINTGNFFTNITELYDINKIIKGDRLNIGGDHSMSIATIAYTLNKYPDAKVIYFDAHADINTYESSKSKHYHGMPLSFLTGLDNDEHFNFIKNKLKFDNLLYIGTRCLDMFERNLIYKNNIKYIEPSELNYDFENTLNKILDFAGNSPIHLSFDVDCMDKSIIPSTGTAVKEGIKLDSGKKILEELKNNTNIVNMDITELNLEIGTYKEKNLSKEYAVDLFKCFFN